MAPASRPPMFARSAKGPSISSWYSSDSGMLPDPIERLVAGRLERPWQSVLLPISPAKWLPSATTQAPVSVAMSIRLRA